MSSPKWSDWLRSLFETPSDPRKKADPGVPLDTSGGGDSGCDSSGSTDAGHGHDGGNSHSCSSGHSCGGHSCGGGGSD